MKRKKGVDIEPNEIFLDKLAQKKEEELGISRKMLERALSKRILQGFLIISLILILVLVSKVVQLQVFKGEELRVLAEKNRFIVYNLQAERGVIYDKELRQLVFNRPAFDLILDKRELPNSPAEQKKVLRKVAQILGKDDKVFEKLVNSATSSQLLIAENLSHELLIVLESRAAELTGFKIEPSPIREYISPVFSHLLGYMGKINKEELQKEPGLYSIFDYVGRTGVEQSFEEFLRKKPGQLKVERDVLGNPIGEEIVSLPQSGQSVVLWLDSRLQEKIAQVLVSGVKKSGAAGAAAVALDPKTGGVLALLSYPFFDNNLFNKKAPKNLLQELLESKEQPLFNRAIAGLYPVGSTIKPLLASAALEEKIISPQQQINCQGFIAVANPYYPAAGPEFYIYHDWKAHGLTDVKKAIAQSCNVFFYIVGGGYQEQKGLGPSKIKHYLNLFGWGDLTGIDLPGEKKGLVPDPNWKKAAFQNAFDQLWRDGDTYNLSIGQGYLAISPLQVATAFVAVANGGILYQPQVAQKIVEGDRNSLKIVKEFPPKILRKDFIGRENLEVVREGMRQTVTAGSATGWLDTLPVKVAAKTGTAQTGKKGYYHNWLTVFGPFDDPEIVLVLLLEDVPGVQAAALPIAKEILEWYFKE